MDNKKIQCVTFPRSGHHLLVGALKKYFGPDMRYCAFYTHCFETPCGDPRTNFQKNHDSYLTLINSPSWHYIIQYRNPIEAIMSHYEVMIVFWDKPEEERMKNKNYKYLSESWKGYENQDSWEWYIQKQIYYWQAFVRKWVINNANKNTCMLPYFEFMTDPLGKLKEVILFVAPERDLNDKLLRAVVKERDIRPRRDIKEFKYYDPVFLKNIEKRVAAELEILNLKSIF